MKIILFDFNEILTLSDFYKIFKQKTDLPLNVANNLDGLWDAITGIVELPMKIEFHNLNLDQLDKFQELISLFEDAEKETNSEFVFSYFIFK